MSRYPYMIDDSTTLPPAFGSDAGSINANIEATENIETALGILPAGIYASVRTRLDILEARINNPLAPSPNVNNPFYLGGSPISGVSIQTGTGDPSVSMILAVPGSLYLRQDGYSIQGLYTFRPDGYWYQVDSDIFTAAGDLSGTPSNQTVIRIQNNPVQALALGSGQDGFVLTWNNASGMWQAKAITSGSVTLAGDATGPANSNVVSKIQTIPVSATTPLTNQVLEYNGSQYIPTSLPTSLPPSGAAGGNLSGTYPNPVVSAISNVTVPTLPSANQVLTATSGTAGAWALISNAQISASAAITTTKLAPGTGGQLMITNSTPAATFISLTGDSTLSATGVMTNTGLQGVALPVPSGTSTALTYNGAVLAWTPFSSIFTAAGDLAGSSSSQEVVGLLSHTLPSLSDGYLNWTGSAWTFSSIGSGFTAGGDLTGSGTSQTLSKIQGNTVNAASLGAVDDGYALTWVNTSSQWQPRPMSASFGTYAIRPAPGNIGHTFIASDGLVSFVDDGNEWRPMIQGVPGWEVAPNNSLSSFTQVGLTPTNSNVQSGCIYIEKDSTGINSLCGYEVSKGVGWTLTAHIIPVQFPQLSESSAVGLSGIWVRDTSSGQLEGIFIGKTGGVNSYNYVKVYTYTTLSTFNGDLGVGGSITPFTHGIWLRIADSGSSNIFSWSYDGQNWMVVGTDTYVPSRGNMYGFGLDPNGINAAMTVQSFQSLAPAFPIPTFSLATPNVGSAAGGWALTLTGSGFTGTSGVTIAGQPCTSVVVVNDTTITCIAPAFSTPNGSSTASPIVITTPGGSISSSSIPTNYYYYPSNQTLRAAYRGDVGISVSLGIVTQWNDLSGNGNNLTRPSGIQGPGQTTVNGLLATTWTGGGSSGLSVGAPPGFTAGLATMCVVASANSYPAAGGTVSYLECSGGFQMGMSAINIGGGSGTNSWTLTDATATNLGLLVGPYNTSQLYAVAGINNGAINSARYVNNDDTSATGSQGALSSIFDFSVGKHLGTADTFDGTICEVLLYEGACSGSDIATIYQIQKAVWGIP